MALVVSKDDAGSARVPDAPRLRRQAGSRGAARGRAAAATSTRRCSALDEEPYERPAVVAYRRESVELVRGREGELDVELVDRHGLDGHRATRRVATRLSARSTAARRTWRSSSAGRASTTSSTVARRGERMPPKSTYFFPKPLSGLLFHPLESMTPWLETCRLCVADIRDVLDGMPTRVEREPVLRLGEGGDETTAIDQAAEDAVVARLAALDEDFVLVSEELGVRVVRRGGRAPSGRRSDRRLGEREARDPVLLVLARRGRGLDDG